MQEQGHGWWIWRKDKRRVSPLLLRILAVNILPLAILVSSILYMGRYQEKLIDSETASLFLQARLSASALAEGAAVVDRNDHTILSPLLSRFMIRRLVEANETRTRLYDLDDTLLADSRIILESHGKIERITLPPPSQTLFLVRQAMQAFDWIDDLLERRVLPFYLGQEEESLTTYELVQKSLSGDAESKVWRLPEGGLLLTVSLPVQRYKQVLGAVVLSRTDYKINDSMREVRLGILQVFAIILFLTILLSFYLTRAIAQPLRLLSSAADRVRRGQAQIIGLAGTANLLGQDVIPDFSSRLDEIGDLSLALRDMTSALAQRVGAIENFAADVAHEIKNPLTSLKSAVETAEKIHDPEMQLRLMQVIRDDVDRLDRLISDIADASRLDAELSRDEAAVLDLVRMLKMLVGFYHLPDDGGAARATVSLDVEGDEVLVSGVERRLVQVVQNLVSNALSFSGSEGMVSLRLFKVNHSAFITVEDQGPGIPENKLEAIFDRFYTERPKGEKFGKHSGLGLSISKQIIEAHRGRIWAENVLDDHQNIVGSRFSVELPLSE